MPKPLRTGPLEELRLDIMACNRCPLSGERNQAVPGRGPASAKIMLIGEAPGKNEDACGEPFVGRAGEKLNEWLTKAGIDRDTQCYVTNVLKCRPPGNRFPKPDDPAYKPYYPPTECWHWLEQQIKAIDPVAIILFGKQALQYVLLEGSLDLADPVGPWIGRFCRRRDRFGEVRFGISYHPAYILRNNNPYEENRCLDALLDVRAYVDAVTAGRPAPVAEELYEVRPATPIQYQRRLRLFGMGPTP